MRSRPSADGAAQVAPVRAAWKAFSSAFREYPYDGAVLYNGPQQFGPANLLFASPTGYHATMVGFPYDDLNAWRGPYPPEVFASQFEKVARGWQAGVAELRGVSGTAALEDQRLAQAASLHFASAANQARFVLARSAGRRDEMARIARGEAAARPSTLRPDSRRLAHRLRGLQPVLLRAARPRRKGDQLRIHCKASGRPFDETLRHLSSRASVKVKLALRPRSLSGSAENALQ